MPKPMQWLNIFRAKKPTIGKWLVLIFNITNMFNKRNLVWVIGAFMSKDEKTGSLHDYCKIELFADTEEEALKRAKKLINKNYFEVIQIVEVEEKK